ncbi:NUD1 [Candida oxycetoniae]|uniref:NUD1 n=1 Tax=Candida oxycetoniae TaxID=497107 RepID=A0AAI9SYR4_9ASCO|nr:NUD1 [Candida oxycetoniae]KAI3405683.2 NUD1 [Candida oxycetoniae]
MEVDRAICAEKGPFGEALSNGQRKGPVNRVNGLGLLTQEEEQEEEEEEERVNEMQKGNGNTMTMSTTMSKESKVFLTSRQQNLYQKQVKYIPNCDFSGNKSSLIFSEIKQNTPQGSVPNTFQYKSHPNAKSRELGESYLGEDGSHSEQSHQSHTTSSFRHTPDWMPAVLEDEWPSSADAAAVEIGNANSREQPIMSAPRSLKRGSFRSMDFNSSNTMIHNSDVQLRNSIPWLKSHESPAPKNLRQIFHDSNDYSNKDASSIIPTPTVTIRDKNNNNNGNSNDNGNGNGNDNGNGNGNGIGDVNVNGNGNGNGDVNGNGHINDSIIESIKRPISTIVEHSMPAPTTGSPLKLFGDNYDTFTKQTLNGVIQNMKSNKNTPAQKNNNNHPHHYQPKSLNKKELPRAPLGPNFQVQNLSRITNIRAFTKTGSYTDKSYLANADKIFSNIKKKGFAVGDPNVRIVSQNTATSTPKKVEEMGHQEEDFASFTTGYDSDGASINGEGENDNDNDNDDDDSGGTEKHETDSFKNYTSVTKDSFDNTSKFDDGRLGSSFGVGIGVVPFRNNQEHQESDYTQGSFTDTENGAEEDIVPLKLPSDSPNRMKSRREGIWEETAAMKLSLNKLPRQVLSSTEYLENPDYHIEKEDSYYHPEPMKWKAKSQLKLGLKNPGLLNRISPVVELPSEYDDMIFNKVNGRWENKHGVQNKTLDKIDDLVDNINVQKVEEKEMEKEEGGGGGGGKGGGEAGREVGGHLGILKQDSQSRRQNLEVSFHEPASPSLVDYKGQVLPLTVSEEEVTRLSQVNGDVSFSESKKQLVSVITDILDTQEELRDWEDVQKIDLSSSKLRNVNDLASILPNLTELNLSNNKIKYLGGIPSKILALDLGSNEIENRTSFGGVYNLHHLALDYNFLTHTMNLSKNIHLTSLTLSNNFIEDISGLKALSNLITLDLSHNKIEGHLDLSTFDFKRLQVLNLLDNKIHTLEGVDSLSSLKVFCLDNNVLSVFDCTSGSICKLTICGNKLKCLDLSKLSQLRSVKFDGNAIVQFSTSEANFIDSISLKSQPHLPELSKQVFENLVNVRRMDLSGNEFPLLSQAFTFLFVSKLTMTAMNLNSLPFNFSSTFPNVKLLNLNFNSLKTLRPLSGLSNLRQLSLVNNKLPDLHDILASLESCRGSLQKLDLRLNPISIDIYPYLFVADDLENSTIGLETVDDIDTFAKRLEEIDATGEWKERDNVFLQGMLEGGAEEEEKEATAVKRRRYTSAIILYFSALRVLDGIVVNNCSRNTAYQQFRELYPKN